MLLHIKFLCCITSFRTRAHTHTQRWVKVEKEIFCRKLYLTLWEEMNPKSEIYDTPKLVAVYIALGNLFETWCLMVIWGLRLIFSFCLNEGSCYYLIIQFCRCFACLQMCAYLCDVAYASWALEYNKYSPKARLPIKKHYPSSWVLNFGLILQTSEFKLLFMCLSFTSELKSWRQHWWRWSSRIIDAF